MKLVFTFIPPSINTMPTNQVTQMLPSSVGFVRLTSKQQQTYAHSPLTWFSASTWYLLTLTADTTFIVVLSVNMSTTKYKLWDLKSKIGSFEAKSGNLKQNWGNITTLYGKNLNNYELNFQLDIDYKWDRPFKNQV